MQRILIVEDEQTLAFALQETLLDEGYEVDIANNGEEALGLFRKKGYGVVITDLKMPRMSGMELLREIRKISADTEVIIVTAYGSMDTAIDALRLRSFDFLMKPYPIEKLKASVSRALESYVSRRIVEDKDSHELTPFTGDGSGKFILSWDGPAVKRLSFMVDIFNAQAGIFISFFEADDELLSRNEGIIIESRGWLRSRLFAGASLVPTLDEFKEYLSEIHCHNGWRALLGRRDVRGEKIKLCWEGSQQHLVFSRKSGRVHNLIAQPSLRKSRTQNGEYVVPFSGGDSIIFLPSGTVEYINRRMGLMEFLSITETCLRKGGNAVDIRKAISSDNDVSPPPVALITARDAVSFNRRLRVTVPAEREKLGEMKYLAEEVCSRCGLPDDASFDVVTALNEALLNSMLHGYRMMKGDIDVVFAREGRNLTVEVRDGGDGFMAGYAKPENENSYEWTTRPKGRGLAMIEKLMDGVEVKSEPGKGTLIRMLKKIP